MGVHYYWPLEDLYLVVGSLQQWVGTSGTELSHPILEKSLTPAGLIGGCCPEYHISIPKSQMRPGRKQRHEESSREEKATGLGKC